MSQEEPTKLPCNPELDFLYWFDGKKIDEMEFCRIFLGRHPMKCVRDRLFTVDGIVEDERQISQLILQEVSQCVTTGLSKLVSNLLASVKLLAYSPPLPIETDRIHVANGTYFMNKHFLRGKDFCNNRLTVNYNPDAPAAGEVAAVPVGTVIPGGHSHLAGIPGLLFAPHHQGPEDADAHWQGR